MHSIWHCNVWHDKISVLQIYIILKFMHKNVAELMANKNADKLARIFTTIMQFTAYVGD